MTISRPTTSTRWKLLTALLVAVVQVVCIGYAFAQDKVPEATGDVEQPNPAQNATNGAAATPPKGEEPTEDSAAVGPTNGGGEAEESPKPAEVLSAEFGVDVAELDAEGVSGLIESSGAAITDSEKAIARLEDRRDTVTTVRDTLSEQVANLAEAARPALVGPLAASQRRIATLDSQLVVERSRLDRETRKRDLLKAHVPELATPKELEGRAEERKRESDVAEQEALEALERARQREKQELDATVRELLARERKIAEDLLALTREHHETLGEIESEAEAESSDFAAAKAQLLADIDQIPAEPSQSVRVDRADPVFTELVQLRRQAWTALGDARRGLSDAERAVEDADEGVVEAREALEQEEGRRSQLEESVAERRIAVAKAALNLAQQRLEAATAERDAWASQVAEFEARLGFFEETIEGLLDKISSQRRAKFFSITNDQNWSDAVRNARESFYRIAEGALDRWDQLLELDWGIANGAWLWGLVWRLILAAIAVRAVPTLVPNGVKRLTEWMLQRRVFRTRPRLTIKTAELLNCLARPLILYGAIRYVGGYVAATFSEARFVLWIVDAVFAYWIITEVAAALVLPRWLRREQGKRSADDLAHLDETEAAAAADLFGMEAARARKLLRSVRVVVLFWLLATYIPAFVEEMAGVGVISRLVDRAALVGLVGVVYWVMSTWRDDIATIFGRLAKERLPKAVAFVEKHKDRFYGVLIIALASIYVIVFELVVVVRRYLLDTEAFRRASTFAFRKKIEMQAQQREDEDVPEVDVETLPDAYVELFAPEAIGPGSPLHVARGDSREKIFEMHQEWEKSKKQGSVAVVGEFGIGKTTLLAHLVADFESETEVTFETITKKRHRRAQVLEAMAELFGIEQVPGEKMALVRKIREREPRIVVLDDCHHFFMRRIGGFEGFETLLDIVNLTDERHFWVLSFNVHAWSYANRVNSRAHYFGRVLTLDDWSEDEIQELIETRNARSEFAMSFTDLLVTPDVEDGTDYFYEVVKTARGYFRYLHEFSDGNPRLAMLFWLHSIRPQDNIVQVSLFRRPTVTLLDDISDDHWFVLTALAQHGALNADEVSQIINTGAGFCYLALNFFEEVGVVAIDPESERAQLAPLYFRHVMRRLMNSNYLYR